MPGFTLFFKRRKIGEYEFEEGRIRIGRHPDSEIFVPHQSISRLHATIEKKEAGWILENVGAANGLFHNGRMVKVATKVKEGDRIEFGAYILHVEGSAGAGSGDSVDAMLARLSGKAKSGGLDINPGVVSSPVATGQEVLDSTFRMAPQKVIEQRKESNKLMKAHLAWKDGDGKEVVIPLGNVEVTIGSSREADIQIDASMTVGKIHARIQGKGGSHKITPEAWWTKVAVGGKKLKDGRILANGDKILVGTTELEYRAGIFD